MVVKHVVTIPARGSKPAMSWLFDNAPCDSYRYMLKSVDVSPYYMIDFYNSELYTEFCLRWM